MLIDLVNSPFGDEGIAHASEDVRIDTLSKGAGIGDFLLQRPCGCDAMPVKDQGKALARRSFRGFSAKAHLSFIYI